MRFRSRVRIRFGDEDHAGIVYYPRFFDFFHQVFEDFFEAQGLPYRQVLDVDRVGWPAVHASCDWRRPVRFGDVLVVDMTTARLGTKSATFAYRGWLEGGSEDVPHVEASITVACIDMDTFQGRPIPDKYRALFSD
jgi:4-hydroxybenzoyl-CoA thioesterase